MAKNGPGGPGIRELGPMLPPEGFETEAAVPAANVSSVMEPKGVVRERTLEGESAERESKYDLTGAGGAPVPNLEGDRAFAPQQFSQAVHGAVAGAVAGTGHPPAQGYYPPPPYSAPPPGATAAYPQAPAYGGYGAPFPGGAPPPGAPPPPASAPLPGAPPAPAGAPHHQGFYAPPPSAGAGFHAPPPSFGAAPGAAPGFGHTPPPSNYAPYPGSAPPPPAGYAQPGYAPPPYPGTNPSQPHPPPYTPGAHHYGGTYPMPGAQPTAMSAAHAYPAGAYPVAVKQAKVGKAVKSDKKHKKQKKLKKIGGSGGGSGGGFGGFMGSMVADVTREILLDDLGSSSSSSD